jgi:glycerol-3-phosphate dehydrogenase
MIKLQSIQEQHERKLQKTKKDLDYLLKEMNNRSNMIILEDFIKIHMAEMEKCRSNYEEIFKSFVKQVHSQEGGSDCLDSISMSLEQKLEDELNHIKDRYEFQIEKLKECVTNESIEDFEDELSTRLNSERATSEMKGSLLEHTLKLSYKSPKSSFYHS